ncbi:hypothetical protein NBE98_19210 [Clostridium swellfunianum]|uniref:hypothetical protein n=1 Tax=Clostridium swellfunianum TaxID=1367462 RepID=UPI00202E79D0|nr:hypothetical protein [Clostridium swellfunianum]MCM0650497.1 hypothetical protein [Clostridium swellfunianum]
MEKEDLESVYIRLIEKIRMDLNEIEVYCADYFIKEKIHKIIEYIDQDTKNNRTVLADLIKEKMNETKTMNSDLNTDFYFLYRKFLDGKINIQDAQQMYDMYSKELKTP